MTTTDPLIQIAQSLARAADELLAYANQRQSTGANTSARPNHSDAELLPLVRPIVAASFAKHARRPGRHAVRDQLAQLNPPVRVGLKRIGHLIDVAVS